MMKRRSAIRCSTAPRSGRRGRCGACRASAAHGLPVAYTRHGFHEDGFASAVRIARPRLFSRNGFNLFSVRDRDHGGARGAGQGTAWARDVFARNGLPENRYDRLLLLAQPAFLGRVFNPVSFWLAMDGNTLRAAIAEVNNTFGDRHSYLCAKPGFEPLHGADRITAQKIFHVSPFQDVSGGYSFAFNFDAERISILIDLKDGEEGLIATLSGPRAPLTDLSILRSALRRPLGAMRVVALIYMQALILKLKGARYRNRPTPPEQEVS